MKTLLPLIFLSCVSTVAFAQTKAPDYDCAMEAEQAVKQSQDPDLRAVFNRAARECGQRTGQCYTKVVTVCPLKKPKLKVVPKPLIEYRDRVVEKRVEVPVPAPYPVPGPVRIVKISVPIPVCPICAPEGPVVAGLWGAVGAGVRSPYVSGNVGLLLQFPKEYLGLRVYSVLQYGFAAQVLPYVYRGDRVQVHVLDPGVLVTGHPFDYLSDKDVPRRVDLLVGAGVQVKLTCHLALTADVRTDIPDPAKLKDCVGTTGERVRVASAVGNAFAASQVLVGLLLHQ